LTPIQWAQQYLYHCSLGCCGRVWFIIAVGGDDVLIVTDFQYDPSQVAQYGLRPKSRSFDNIWEVRFFSGRFYPTEPYQHYDRVLSFIWGPMVSKQLLKQGWNITLRNEKDQRIAEMWSREKDWNHVPLLRKVRDHVVQNSEQPELKIEEWRLHTTQHHELTTAGWAMFCSTSAVARDYLESLDLSDHACHSESVIPTLFDREQ